MTDTELTFLERELAAGQVGEAATVVSLLADVRRLRAVLKRIAYLEGPGISARDDVGDQLSWCLSKAQDALS